MTQDCLKITPLPSVKKVTQPCLLLLLLETNNPESLSILASDSFPMKDSALFILMTVSAHIAVQSGK